MQVAMLRQRHLQEAGRERVLSVGEVYELPDAIGAALVATGAAERYTVAAISVAPERKTVDGAAPKAPRGRRGR